MKVVGIVKSIVGTDAVIAIDEDGNQRAIFPGDTLYDNEKLLELSGVQVNVEPVTVADSHKKSEPKSDKEVASLQDALLNGKDISELEETAAGGNSGGGNASSDGVYKFKMEAVSPTTGEVFSTKETTPFTVDTNAPTIAWTKLPDNISGGGRINKPNGEEIEFSGKTEPFADVKFIVYDNGLGNSTVIQVRADEHGEFSQKIPDAFPGGIYDVSVQVTDPAGNWVAPIKLPVTEAPIIQPVAPAPSEPAHISDNIFEITRMYTDEDSDLRTSYTPSYPNTTAGFDFKPTFEGKTEPFADITLSIAEQGRYNWQVLGLHDPDIPVDVLTTKADANGNWKVEPSKDYDHGAHKITADVTHTDGSTYHSSTEMFYMPTDPFIVEPVDHL